MSAPNSDGVLTRTFYPFCENVSGRRHCNKVSDRRQVEKSALGDIRECQRSATSRARLAFNGRRFVVTVLSQNSKASPLMRSVFGRMLGYGDVIVRGTLG